MQAGKETTVVDASLPGAADPARSAGDSNSRAAEEAALTSSLGALADLSNATLDLKELLTQVATFAVQAIPGADGAGLTLLEIDRVDLIVKSEPFVREIDAIQYSIGEGPCISAAATGQTKRSGRLDRDPRWPMFGPRASELGVHSALSLPLQTPTKILGAMNVYAHAPDSFGDRAQELGETFSISAALAVQHAQIFEQTIRLADQLQVGLNNRALIDQAIGVLRYRYGETAADSLHRLRKMSADQRISVTDIAIAVIGSTGRGDPQPPVG
jgi:transcriptional regulator with GAF, ATPase, and Fis domain